MRAGERSGRCAGLAGPAWVVSCWDEGGVAARATAVTSARCGELGASTPRSPVAVQARGAGSTRPPLRDMGVTRASARRRLAALALPSIPIVSTGPLAGELILPTGRRALLHARLATLPEMVLRQSGAGLQYSSGRERQTDVSKHSRVERADSLRRSHPFSPGFHLRI